MNTAPVIAVLTCRSGHLAGSRFELNAETIIARDSAGRVVIAPQLMTGHTPDVRIFLRDGSYHLENLGAPGRVLVDGAPVTGTLMLARMHVLELGDDTFMLSVRSAGVSAAAAGYAVAPDAARPDAVRPDAVAPAAGEALGTIADIGGFDALPALRAAPPGEGGTIVDQPGFDPLPQLQRKATAPPSEDSAQTRVYAPPLAEPPFTLVITLPSAGLTTFPLKYGDNLIGRSEGCDVRVQDPEKWLSRKHAILKVADERVELVDLNGSNGTFVKGARVSTAVLLPGSRFTLGPQFEFSLQKR